MSIVFDFDALHEHVAAQPVRNTGNREWRTMDSAPKDGTDILLRFIDDNSIVIVGFYGSSQGDLTSKFKEWRVRWDEQVLLDDDELPHWRWQEIDPYVS